MYVNILPVIFYICLFSQYAINANQEAVNSGNQDMPILSDSSAKKSSSSKKHYSNKEFVYGEQDDEETAVNSLESPKNSEMFEKLDLASLDSDDDTDSFTSEFLKPKPKQKQNKPKMYEDVSDEGESSDDLNLTNLSDQELAQLIDIVNEDESDYVNRNQRYDDSKHQMQERYADILAKFSKNPSASKIGMNTDEDSLDYDDLINNLFKLNSDKFGNEMDSSQAKSKNKQPMNDLNKSLMSILNSEEAMKDFRIDISKFMQPAPSYPKAPKEPKLPSNKNPKFDFKEKMYSESDYNKQYKTASSAAMLAKLAKQESSSVSGENSLEKSNLMNSNLFKDLNLNLNGELLKLTNSLSSKMQPSMAKQNSLGVTEQDMDQQTNNFNSKIDDIRQQNDYLFIFIVTGCILAGLVALIAASVCWYTVNRNSKATSNVEYGDKGTPSGYGIPVGAVGSNNSIKSNSSKNSGDRRLAQSAQMYHYQHQKQQMIAMEKANNENKADNTDNSDGEAEEGDYTVYECPGLAPTGEMEVKNPLFKEDYIQSNAALAKSESITSMPPAYSTVNNESALNQEKQENLVEIPKENK